MIAACPTCGARYRIDAAKLRPEGARLRCTRCEAVFRVQPPAAPERSDVASAPAERPAAASTTPKAPPPRDVATEKRNSARLVLVASPEEDAGRVTDELAAAGEASWILGKVVEGEGVELV